MKKSYKAFLVGAVLLVSVVFAFISLFLDWWGIVWVPPEKYKAVSLISNKAYVLIGPYKYDTYFFSDFFATIYTFPKQPSRAYFLETDIVFLVLFCGASLGASSLVFFSLYFFKKQKFKKVIFPLWCCSLFLIFVSFVHFTLVCWGGLENVWFSSKEVNTFIGTAPYHYRPLPEYGTIVWGPMIGWYLCLSAGILNLAGLILFLYSGRKRKKKPKEKPKKPKRLHPKRREPIVTFEKPKERMVGAWLYRKSA